jgi:hypothetical protein
VAPDRAYLLAAERLPYALTALNGLRIKKRAPAARHDYLWYRGRFRHHLYAHAAQNCERKNKYKPESYKYPPVLHIYYSFPHVYNFFTARF